MTRQPVQVGPRQLVQVESQLPTLALPLTLVLVSVLRRARLWVLLLEHFRLRVQVEPQLLTVALIAALPLTLALQPTLALIAILPLSLVLASILRQARLRVQVVGRAFLQFVRESLQESWVMFAELE